MTFEDTRRIYCPRCGIALTADYGTARQPLMNAPFTDIILLSCPCGAESTIVIDPRQLAEGGASE